jgi:hypothetical protein
MRQGMLLNEVLRKEFGQGMNVCFLFEIQNCKEWGKNNPITYCLKPNN